MESPANKPEGTPQQFFKMNPIKNTSTAGFDEPAPKIPLATQPAIAQVKAPARLSPACPAPGGESPFPCTSHALATPSLRDHLHESGPESRHTESASPSVRMRRQETRRVPGKGEGVRGGKLVPGEPEHPLRDTDPLTVRLFPAIAQEFVGEMPHDLLKAKDPREDGLHWPSA